MGVGVGLLLLGLLLVVVYLRLRRHHSVVIPGLIEAPHLVAGEEPHSIWGSLASLRKNTAQTDLYAQLDRNYFLDPNRKVVRLHLLFVPVVVLFSPKHFRQVLAKDNFPKSVIYELLRNFLGDGLLNSSGTKWQHHRTLLNTAFGPLHLKGLVSTYADITKVFLRKLEQTEGCVYDLGEELSKLTLDIISKTGFGYDLHSVEDTAPPVGKSMSSLLKLITHPLVALPFGPKLLRWLNRKHFDIVNKVIFDTIEEKLKRRKHAPQQGEETSRSGRDLLDLLLMAASDDASKTMQLTNEEIRDEVLTFFLAGNDTTALTFTWVLYLLHRNPNCLERLVKEIDSVLLDPNDPEKPPRDPAYEDFVHFKYLTMVLKETLRLCPAVSIVSRRTPEDVEFDGYSVKKGQMVILPIYTVHHDPELWNNPNEFDPERWNEENVAASSANFFGFSHGPRSCIGQQFFWNEAKVTLPMLLSRFTFTIENKGEVSGTDKTGTLWPSVPIHIRFTKRRRN